MLTWATFHRQEIEQSLQTVRGVSKHLIVVIHSEFSSPGMISSKSPPFFTFPHSRFPWYWPNHLSRIGQIHHHTTPLKPSPQPENIAFNLTLVVTKPLFLTTSIILSLKLNFSKHEKNFSIPRIQSNTYSESHEINSQRWKIPMFRMWF